MTSQVNIVTGIVSFFLTIIDLARHNNPHLQLKQTNEITYSAYSFLFASKIKRSDI